MALRRRFPLSQDDTQDDGYQPIGMGQRPMGQAPQPVTPEPAPVFQQPQTSQPTDLRTQPVPYRPPQGTPAPTPYTPTPGPAIPVSNPTAPSSMNTDGYAAPAYIPKGAGAAMSGWDATKWGNVAHQTPKYGVGRILSNYAPTVEGLSQAMADIQRAYPGSTFNGKDKVTIPGVGTIDVLQGASQGGSAWQWMDLPEEGVQPAVAAGPADLSPIDPDSPVMRNAIMDLLEGQGQRPLRTAQYRRTEAM